MNRELVQRVADAILYEGYLLYPYRASAVKNRHRWTFGALYPPAYCSMNRGSEISSMQVEMILEDLNDATVQPILRFLHLISIEGSQQAEEREIAFPSMHLRDLIANPKTLPFDFAKTVKEDRAFQEAIYGRLTVSAKRLDSTFSKLTIRVLNETIFEDAPEPNREEALLRSFISTHAILHLENGAFVSLLDPPEAAREFADGCKNNGWWPVLVGEEGTRETMLASPIILYDYPRVAPESAGDLFDSTEIDEILTLRILTLTDEEKREMRTGDERARKLLERTESLPPEQFMKLHGAIRGLQKTNDRSLWDPWESKPAIQTVEVKGGRVHKGDRVTLHPAKKADIFDIALNGKIAIIEAIEEDYDGRVHLAVILEDDPGKDLGELRQPGHRFFFTPEEVEAF